MMDRQVDEEVDEWIGRNQYQEENYEPSKY